MCGVLLSKPNPAPSKEFSARLARTPVNFVVDFKICINSLKTYHRTPVNRKEFSVENSLLLKHKADLVQCVTRAKNKIFFLFFLNPSLSTSHRDRYIPVLENFKIRFAFWKQTIDRRVIRSGTEVSRSRKIYDPVF